MRPRSASLSTPGLHSSTASISTTVFGHSERSSLNISVSAVMALAFRSWASCFRKSLRKVLRTFG